MVKSILSLLLLITVSNADYIRDNTKEIVLDTSTYLVWQDSAATIGDSNKKSWSDSISYCESLVLGGSSDWRLPNLNELYMLVDKTNHTPAIDSEFENVVNEYYWSSTTVATNVNAAWSIDFKFGNDYEGGDKTSDAYSVRCVRLGQ